MATAIEDLIPPPSAGGWKPRKGHDNFAPYIPVLRSLLAKPANEISNRDSFNTALYSTLSASGVMDVPSKRKLNLAYKHIIASEPQLAANPFFQSYFVNKAVRSASGILNVSISLPPDKFSCKYNCHFCPNEPGMPRSYLSNEAVFKRAAQVSFNTVQQVYKRLEDLEKSGHVLDKIEFRVLGGTFSCYDHAIADAFVRDLYYGANTYRSRFTAEEDRRKAGTIEEEQALNVDAEIHCVGLGVETRPDEIKPAEIIRFRRYGITRVEIGVQHTDDALLRRVNRGHGVRQSRAAIKLLKDYGFKVEIHIMADLPGATPEGDMACYREVLQGPDLIPDYMKDYPCLDVDFSVLKQWKAEGKWKPYAEENDARALKDVLIYRQSITPKYVRVNRIHRDFQEAGPGCIGFSSQTIKTNMAQIVKDEAEARGIYCQCIRCCELRLEKFKMEDVVWLSEKFEASGATEYFLSAEVVQPNRNLLLGFLRLRLSNALQESVLEELVGKTAMIREIHVYGTLKSVGTDGAQAGAQHLGIGRRLLADAEQLAREAGFEKMAVISGIGVRGYYQKNGYDLRGTYMMKDLMPSALPASAPTQLEKPVAVRRDLLLDCLMVLAVAKILLHIAWLFGGLL